VGTLHVKADVTGVEVVLDGKVAGTAPLRLRDVTAGRHTVVLRREGYREHTEDVEVGAARTASVFAVMQRLEPVIPDLPVRFQAAHVHGAGSCKGRSW